MRSTGSLPLLLAFHGGMGNGQRLARQTGWSEAAIRHGFAVAYPNALGRWHDGRSTTGMGREDIDFVEALIEHLLAGEDLDERRVYACGVSNGGMFVMRLACEIPWRFAGFATVLASMPVEMAGRAGSGPPVPMMMVNAIDDTIMPWNGGKIASGRGVGAGGKVIGVEETLALWRRRNRCGTPRISAVDAGRPYGDIAAELYDYPAGAGGAGLRLLKVHGGGHAWPRLAAPGGLVSDFAAQTANGATDATDLIWDFLSRHAGIRAPDRSAPPEHRPPLYGA